MNTTQTRDTIVVGSSLGGVRALTRLVASLPADLPAAVLIVQHIAAESPGLLSTILDTRGALPARTAADGMALERGHIYVAPPDRHMLLDERGVRVVYGPRENRSRPAVDPLFRTAAVHYGSRVIGVILTGLLGDGAAGLHAVHRCGGVAVVQHPGDAEHPDMPSRALATVSDARQVPLAEMGALLAALVREPAPEPSPVPHVLRIEADLTDGAMTNNDWNDVPGGSTDFTCPECSGALRRIEDGGEPRFRCRVGHAYTGEAMIEAKDEAVEQALWVALQTLQERTQMLETLAAEDVRRGWTHSAVGFEARARETRAHAERLNGLILRLRA